MGATSERDRIGYIMQNRPEPTHNQSAFNISLSPENTVYMSHSQVDLP